MAQTNVYCPTVEDDKEPSPSFQKAYLPFKPEKSSCCDAEMLVSKTKTHDKCMFTVVFLCGVGIYICHLVSLVLLLQYQASISSSVADIRDTLDIYPQHEMEKKNSFKTFIRAHTIKENERFVQVRYLMEEQTKTQKEFLNIFKLYLTSKSSEEPMNPQQETNFSAPMVDARPRPPFTFSKTDFEIFLYEFNTTNTILYRMEELMKQSCDNMVASNQDIFRDLLKMQHDAEKSSNVTIQL